MTPGGEGENETTEPIKQGREVDREGGERPGKQRCKTSVQKKARPLIGPLERSKASRRHCHDKVEPALGVNNTTFDKVLCK